ncbi:hypothetical protein ABIA00_002411 [Bradyrhizobium ottawaense]
MRPLRLFVNLLLLSSIYSIWVSQPALAQAQLWELQQPTTIHCTNQTQRVVGGTLSTNKCYLFAHIIQKGTGGFYTCTANTNSTRLNGVLQIALRGQGKCQPLYTPSTQFGPNTVYTGSYAESMPDAWKPIPPEKEFSGGSAYWVVQQGNYEVYACLRTSDNQRLCITIVYDSTPLP